jgi:hypothetical protein
MDETRETSTSEEVKATTDDAAKGIKGVWNGGWRR